MVELAGTAEWGLSEEALLVPFQVLILGFLYWGGKDSGPFLRLATPILRLEMALVPFQVLILG